MTEEREAKRKEQQRAMMRDVTVAASAQMDATEWGSEAFEVARFALWSALSGAQKEALVQLLYHGPVWDGDVVSKSARDDLFDLGLATRCCFKGEQGHTAASYKAFTVYASGGKGKHWPPPSKPEPAAPSTSSEGSLRVSAPSGDADASRTDVAAGLRGALKLIADQMTSGELEDNDESRFIQTNFADRFDDMVNHARFALERNNNEIELMALMADDGDEDAGEEDPTPRDENGHMIPLGFIRSNGDGKCPVHPEQAIEIYCGYDNVISEFVVMRADDAAWAHQSFTYRETGAPITWAPKPDDPMRSSPSDDSGIALASAEQDETKQNLQLNQPNPKGESGETDIPEGSATVELPTAESMAGEVAHNAGDGLWDNPHREHSYAWYEWRRGWISRRDIRTQNWKGLQTTTSPAAAPPQQPETGAASLDDCFEQGRQMFRAGLSRPEDGLFADPDRDISVQSGWDHEKDGNADGEGGDSKPNLDNDLVVETDALNAEVIPAGSRETPPELAFVDEPEPDHDPVVATQTYMDGDQLVVREITHGEFYKPAPEQLDTPAPVPQGEAETRSGGLFWGRKVPVGAD